MKNTILKASAIAALVCTASQAFAQDDFRIGVGQPGRGYEARGKAISARIDGSEVVNYEGSDEISIAVCSGDVELGIVQNDARYMRSTENCDLQVVAEYGTEYAFILFPENSSNGKLRDLEAGDKILADTIGSGTDLFVQNIRAIEAEHGDGSSWTEASIVNSPLIASMATAMAATGDIDAIIMVGNPNSQEVLDLVADGWYAGALKDKDIDDLIYNGSKLYERETVKIGATGFMRGNNEPAYLVPSYIVVNAEWMGANRQAFATVARAVAASK